MFFLNDFLREEPCHWKLADDSAIIIQGWNESDITKKVELFCMWIGLCCNNWGMGVNGSKTELIVINLESNTSVPILNNELCAFTSVTKSLSRLIDDKLSYRDHAERVVSKAKCRWDNAPRVLGCKWSLAIQALVLLYKTFIVPQLLNVSAIWFWAATILGSRIEAVLSVNFFW